MTIFIPGFLIIVLRKKYYKKLINSVKCRRIYGYFYNEYKDKLFFWEFITILFKVIIAILSGIFHENQAMKLSSIIMVIFIMILLTQKYKPFISIHHSKLFIISSRVMFGCLLTQLCIILMFESEEPSHDDYKIIGTIVVLMANIYFFFYAMSQLFPYIDYELRSNKCYLFIKDRIPFL